MAWDVRFYTKEIDWENFDRLVFLGTHDPEKYNILSENA